jgi:dynein heavy chain 2, cytosolic
MKKMINLPSGFKSLGDTDIFTQLVENNSQSLMNVYFLAENLFVRLSKVQDTFKEWVILGTVDIDEFVEDAVVEIADYEMNFRMIKQKGKEAEQLPLSVTIDCITVNTAPVKATIDDHLQRLFDALLSSLRKSINMHLRSIEEFTSTAMDVLLRRPQSMAEIGLANAKHEELSNSKMAIQAHFESSDSLNRLLKSVVGSGKSYLI